MSKNSIGKNIIRAFRGATSGRFQTAKKREHTRIERGAEMFADRYSKTMKMLAEESRGR